MEVIFNINYFVMAIILTILIFVIARVYNDKLNYKKDIHFKDKDVEVVSEDFNKIEFLQNDNGKLRADLSILKSRFDALTKAIGRE